MREHARAEEPRKPNPASAALPGSPPVSHWVQAHLPLALPGHRALDLACGSGRHALWMAQAGFDVLAVDRNEESLTQLTARWAQSQRDPARTGRLRTECLDLEADVWPLSADRCGHWDLIVVTNYLYRPHLHNLPAILARGGVLIYETFAIGNADFGRPSNPDFLLESGELDDFARRHGLEVLDFAQGYVEHPKPAVTQRICARMR